MVCEKSVALACVRDCSGNPFLLPLSKKDCNGKPDHLAAELNIVSYFAESYDQLKLRQSGHAQMIFLV
jgi:hypothetical protein